MLDLTFFSASEPCNLSLGLTLYNEEVLKDDFCSGRGGFGKERLGAILSFVFLKNDSFFVETPGAGASALF